MSGDPERTVVIPITATDQDGATGADYSGVPQNVTFNPGAKPPRPSHSLPRPRYHR